MMRPPVLALHLRDCRLAHQERAFEVGVEIGVPDFLRERLDAGAAGDAGIVDEDIDPAKALDPSRRRRAGSLRLEADVAIDAALRRNPFRTTRQ